MKIKNEKNCIILENMSDFEPELIFECGQCFRWERQEDGSYLGVAFGKAARVSKSGNDVRIRCGEADFADVWRSYFDIDRDYESVRMSLPTDEYTAKAVEYGTGLRILRQDIWEAICSFIISQCNNISRIKSIISRLCAMFGEPVSFEGRHLYSFPAAETLAALSEAELAPLRCGYRASYILDAARVVASGELDLDRLRRASSDEARRELKTISGVGDKVANCVLLFGLGHVSAFPVDVWMRRALDDFYGGSVPESFGEYAGIAQQYIFHYTRTANNPKKKSR